MPAPRACGCVESWAFRPALPREVWAGRLDQLRLPAGSQMGSSIFLKSSASMSMYVCMDVYLVTVIPGGSPKGLGQVQAIAQLWLSSAQTACLPLNIRAVLSVRCASCALQGTPKKGAKLICNEPIHHRPKALPRTGKLLVTPLDHSPEQMQKVPSTLLSWFLNIRGPRISGSLSCGDSVLCF